MTTDPPPPSSSQRDAFLRELVSALRDTGVEKIDPAAAAKRGNGSSGCATSMLTDQHRSRARSSTSVTSSSSSLHLARAAHARLQFDHPSLDADAVDALSRAVGELNSSTKSTRGSLAGTDEEARRGARGRPAVAGPPRRGREQKGTKHGEADEDKATGQGPGRRRGLCRLLGPPRGELHREDGPLRPRVAPPSFFLFFFVLDL